MVREFWGKKEGVGGEIIHRSYCRLSLKFIPLSHGWLHMPMKAIGDSERGGMEHETMTMRHVHATVTVETVADDRIVEALFTGAVDS